MEGYVPIVSLLVFLAINVKMDSEAMIRLLEKIKENQKTNDGMVPKGDLPELIGETYTEMFLEEMNKPNSPNNELYSALVKMRVMCIVGV